MIYYQLIFSCLIDYFGQKMVKNVDLCFILQRKEIRNYWHLTSWHIFFFKTDNQNEFNNKPVLNLYTSKVWEAADDSMRRRRAAAINLFIILNLRKVKANTWINSLYIFSLLSDGLCCWCCSTVHEADDVWQPLFL